MNAGGSVHIADILPPSAPVSSSVHIWLYVLLLLVSVAIAVSIFVYIRYVASGRYQLRRLHQQHLRHKTGNRQLALQLNRLLCQRLELPRISTSAFLGHQDNRQWQLFSTALLLACFSRKDPDDDAMQALLNAAGQWF